MKIFELFNNNKSPVDLDKDQEKDHNQDEFKFDLGEDLVYFMHNNDNFYRKNFFPILKVCKNKFDAGRGFSHRIFKPVVIKAYEEYKKEFPLRELEDKLEDSIYEKISRQIYETELGFMRDGRYE